MSGSSKFPLNPMLDGGTKPPRENESHDSHPFIRHTDTVSKGRQHVRHPDVTEKQPVRKTTVPLSDKLFQSVTSRRKPGTRIFLKK